MIQIKLISRHFDIDKTRELVGRKYYWPSLRKDVEAYIKGCNICLLSKAVKQKFYSNLQALPILTHRWKNFLIDFVTRLSVLTDWKRESCDSILVIINWWTKMVHYELVKVIINALKLAEVIVDMVVRPYSLSNSIISDKRLLFNSKFWLLLCYFLGIKRRLSTAFHS